MVVEVVYDRLHVRRNFHDIEACDKAQLHERMRADVAEAKGTAGELRIGAPVGALFTLLGEPPLYVGSVRPADFAEKAAGDDKARKPGSPVSQIGVGDGERQSALYGFVGENVGLLAIYRERLFTHHGNSRLYRLDGGVEVHEIGGDDEDIVELLVVGKIFLVVNHVDVGRVSLDGIGPFGRLVHGDLRIRMERGSRHAARAVRENRLLMGLGDKRPAAAAYESYV